jgi:TPR repeat protein
MIAALHCAHGALWQSDAWYRRAWWIAPQLLAVVLAVAIMTGGSGGAAGGGDWAQPATAKDAYTETLALRDRAETDPAEFAKLRAMANSGDSGAQFALGSLYDSRLRLSRLVAPDDITATVHYRNAALQGNIDAANNYGSALAFGYGGPRNIAEGLPYLVRAANANDVFAQRSLGELYRDGGPGLRADTRQSLQWFQLAANNGNRYSQAEIGAAYWDGKPPYAKNPFEAVKWYTQAAQDQSEVGAARMLGIAYRDGLGAPRDPAAALAWFQRGAAGNDAYSIQQVKLLGGR